MVRGHTNAINNICFDNAGKLLASCSSDLSIKIWKFDNPMKCIKTLSGHEHLVSSVVFSPDGNLLYSCSRDKTIKIWEVQSGFSKKTLKGHDDWVRSISLNEKGDLLASCSDDESVIVWTTDKGEQRTNFLSIHDNKIEKVMFINNEQAKHSIFNGDFNVSDSGQKDDEISEHQEKANELNKRIHDSKMQNQKIEREYILTCSRDKNIKLFDVFNNVCIYTFSGHDNWVRNLCIHPNGKYLVSTGDDRNIRIWCLKSGRSVKKLDKIHEKFIVSLAMSSSLNIMVTGSNDLSIKFWECR
jgi:platelet-activating factor acetylhydrolase IB subunit alpha